MEAEERAVNRALTTSTSSFRGDMERSSGSRQNEYSLFMARLSSFAGWNHTNGDWSWHGHNRILLARFYAR